VIVEGAVMDANRVSERSGTLVAQNQDQGSLVLVGFGQLSSIKRISIADMPTKSLQNPSSGRQSSIFPSPSTM